MSPNSGKGRRSAPRASESDPTPVPGPVEEPEAGEGGAAFGDPQLENDLAAELELAQRQASDHLELARRVQAEFENFRKRISREQAEVQARAGERVIEKLLPVLDNLERAIDHVTAGGEVQDLLKGVEMVHGQMLDVLDKEGIAVIDPFGQPFDPLVHAAVGTREDESVPDHTVVDVYQKGYSLGGRAIRPAMVVVSTRGPQREPEGAPGGPGEGPEKKGSA